jgi:hypothetical protein
LNTPESTVSRLPGTLPPPARKRGAASRISAPRSDPVGRDAELHHPVLNVVIHRFGIPLGETPGVLSRVMPHGPLRWWCADHGGHCLTSAPAAELDGNFFRNRSDTADDRLPTS